MSMLTSAFKPAFRSAFISRHNDLCRATFAVLTLAVSLTAYADATLDKIRERGKITVGVLLDGTYGSIDPLTRKPLGYSVELAESL
eukprot:gene22745-28986_t